MKRVFIESLGHFVGGQWRDEGPTFENRSPQDLSHLVGLYREGTEQIVRAVTAAERAQSEWAQVPLEERIAVLEAFGTELWDRSGCIAEAIVAETGKTLRWAKVEAAALPKKVGITAETARARLRPTEIEGTNGYVVRRPLGVFAVIGPFNFPVHLSHGHIVPALMAGNVAILKPSETSPASAQRYVEAWIATASRLGVNPNLLQLVQGGGATGAALVGHGGVNGVAFTGSHHVGVAIRRQTAHQTSKLLALEMGGKNTAIVLADADLERAADDLAQAAYVMSGQRCTATSRVVADHRIVEPLGELLASRVSALRLGDPFEPIDLGPLSTPGAARSFAEWQASDAGLRALVEPVSLEGLPRGCWAAPRLYRVTDRAAAHARDQTELFGPEVLVHSADGLDDAIALANNTPYGLAMSVHSASEAEFESVRPRLEAGLVNWNRGTAGASSLLPFGGIKQSGNHRPAGASAIEYTTHPVSVLRG